LFDLNGKREAYWKGDCSLQNKPQSCQGKSTTRPATQRELKRTRERQEAVKESAKGRLPQRGEGEPIKAITFPEKIRAKEKARKGNVSRAGLSVKPKKNCAKKTGPCRPPRL